MKITFENSAWPQLVYDIRAFIEALDGVILPFPKAVKAKDEPEEASDEVSEAEVKEANPVRDRRAGRSRGDSKPAAEAGEKPTGRRARRASPAAEKPAATAEKPAKKLTDVALTKHASQAAETITPKRVKAILKSFGAKDVAALEGDDRQAFVDKLEAEVGKKKV